MHVSLITALKKKKSLSVCTFDLSRLDFILFYYLFKGRVTCFSSLFLKKNIITKR